MSFALAYQSKTNNTGDAKTSTPAKRVSSSTPHHHINNLAMDSPDYILNLQRAIGNQGVQKLIRSNNADGFDFSKIGIIQPKLEISKPGDVYEQEADRIAE